MDKHAFRMIACRFHTKDKNKFYIIGQFEQNEKGEHLPLIKLDGQELACTAIEKHKKCFLEVVLPNDWKSRRKLEVFNVYEDAKELLFTMKTSKMEQLEKQIAMSVDAMVIKETGICVEGWYMNTAQTAIQFRDHEGKELEAQMQYKKRLDVLREYPENTIEEVVGYSACFTGVFSKKVQVIVSDGNCWNQGVVKEEKPSIKEVINKGLEWMRKGKDYYRQFGLYASVIHTYDILTGQDYTGYEAWLRRHTPSKMVLYRQRKQKMAWMPKISIVVPVYRTPEQYLREMIDSVRKQSYTNFELCISDGSGSDSPVAEILREYERKDARIRVVYNEKRLHISDNTNQALKIATGDFIAFLDHDDLLVPEALYTCVCEINRYPESEFLYSDEDKVDESSKSFFLPHFKSDFNIDLLRSVNYICHFVMVKRQLFERVGLLNAKYDGAQDYDFVLRCVEETSAIRHIPKILYHWRACEGSTADNAANKQYIIEAGANAIKAHYERAGIKASVWSTQYGGMYHSKYELSGTPLVSIIIPNKDHVDDLDKCLQSIEKKSNYKNVEYIIVENNSTEEKTFAYYQKLEKENPKAHVLYWDGKGFNYPAINNYGVQHAKGEYLLLLNNDTEMIHEDCIEELLGYCMRDDVGAVGARLYYEDGTVQHAGVIVGLGGVAGHAFLGQQAEDPGYFARAILAQDLSAVTAACVMIKRSVYEEVEGLDEQYAVAFNDVDLCMKIRKAGYLIVYNPNAELMHYESKSRGYEDTEEKIKRFHSEIELFQNRWSEFLKAGDPYYNPNLTLDRNDFSLHLGTRKERG